jgi:hypothetical protein
MVINALVVSMNGDYSVVANGYGSPIDEWQYASEVLLLPCEQEKTAYSI